MTVSIQCVHSQPQSSKSKPSPKKRRKRPRLGSRRSKRLGKRQHPSSTESSTEEEEEEERESASSDTERDIKPSLPPAKLRREKLPSQGTDTPHQTLSVSSVNTDSKPDIAALAAVSVLSHRPRKRKRIPYTLVEASKGNRCPTSGCDGVGHITGLYAMHFAVSGCPLAHGKTPEECKARREELNRLRTKTLPPQESGGGGGGGGGVEVSQSSKHLKMASSNTGGSSLASSRRTTAVSLCGSSTL